MKVGTDGVLLGAWTQCDGATRMLDVGTGSGLIALMLAQRSKPECCIEAIDIDADASQQAADNFRLSPWAARLSARQLDVTQYSPEHRYDLIVSNPPYYISGPEIQCEKRAQARYAHCFSGEMLLQRSSNLLTQDGSIALVIPYEYGLQLLECLEINKLHLWRRCDILTRSERPPHRMLLQLSRQPLQASHTQLMLHAEQGGYSEQFITLTREFYLRM